MQGPRGENDNCFNMGVEPKIGGKPPKSSILIGFSIIFTIHFGVPLFLQTPILVLIHIHLVHLYLFFSLVEKPFVTRMTEASLELFGGSGRRDLSKSWSPNMEITVALPP